MSVDLTEAGLPPAQAGTGMHMDVAWGAGRARVRVTGELDAATAPRLRRCVSELAELGVDDVLLDLSGVSLLDCAGLGALVSAKKRMRATGGDVLVVSTSRNVRRVLDLTGFAPAFGLDGTHPDGGAAR